MELLVLLVILLAVNVALWLGLGVDSREADNNWHPATPADGTGVPRRSVASP